MVNPPEKTILVIDDEAAIRRSFADYLEDMGYRILTAENGRIGVDLFDRQAVDLVMVDLRMPEMDGLEVLAHIRRNRPQTPAIVVSGTGVISDAVEAIHQGAWDYILKPVKDLHVLSHAVEMALERVRLKEENAQYQEHLEQMVAERTRELELANDHLLAINRRLRRIVETTRSLSFCSEVGDFGTRLLNEFGRLMTAAGGSMYIKEKDGLRLIHSLNPGHAPAFIPFPLPETSVFQQVAFQQKPLLIEDIASRKDLLPDGWDGYRKGSALIFPLLDAMGDVAAILTLHRQTPPFMEQDEEIGAILASYSSEALRAVRATESLRENERRFRSILDTIRAGVIIVETEKRNIVYANFAAANLIRLEPAKIAGMPYEDIVGSDPDAHDGRGSITGEKWLKAGDGRQIPVLKTVTGIRYKGKECRLESFIDLTDQKAAAKEKEALESQLRQAQKMDALGTLAGGIAHDFNNMLGIVIGNSQLGLMEIDDSDDSLRQQLTDIFQAGNRAKELVRQILTFSRMQEQCLSSIRIDPIVREALKLLNASLPAHIELKSEINTRQQVMADATQIHQVVINLCTNAYHAMEENGGTLAVSLESVFHKEGATAFPVELSPGNYVRLSVEDTGTGIDPLVLENIFDPYFSTKDKDKGTGLGLSVVHGIVSAHGGLIDVASNVGEGTAFHVFFPVTEAVEKRPVEHRTLLPRGGEKILLVDDEKSLVDICSRMLDLLGYDVTGVVGSAQALDLFKQDPLAFDLVMTDMNMPVMTGDRLAAEIGRIRPEIPIVLCTGFSERVNQEHMQQSGIRKLVMKPMTMDILAEAVRQVLDESP